MKRRGFLRMAMGALGIAAALGVSPAILAPIEEQAETWLCESGEWKEEAPKFYLAA